MTSRTKTKTCAVLALLVPIAGCTKSESERREDQAEERQELREDATEQAAPGIHPNVPEAVPGEPVTNEATARKGLEQAAVDQITAARCEREAKCNNIGQDKTYASTDACRQKISEDWRDELNTYDCPGGVVVKELKECLEEIQNENCDSPFDTLGRIVACRSSDICKALD